MPFAPELDPDDWPGFDVPNLCVYGDPFPPEVLLGPGGEVLVTIERPFGLARFLIERRASPACNARFA